MTELVIRTIYRNTSSGFFSVHVIDNGSDIETISMLRRLQAEGLIHSLVSFKSNRGLEYARQHALEHFTYADTFIDIDNDCLPPPPFEGLDWIWRQQLLMDKYPDYAAISQRTQVMIGSGDPFEEVDKTGQDILPFPHPGGSFRMMRTGAVIEAGGWYPAVPGRGSEEKKICGRLRDAGYATAFATNIRCWHLFGTRSEGHLTDRWGYAPGMKPEDSGHSDIWHPALGNGDEDEESMQQIRLYAGNTLAKEYYGADGNN